MRPAWCRTRAGAARARRRSARAHARCGRAARRACRRAAGARPTSGGSAARARRRPSPPGARRASQRGTLSNRSRPPGRLDSTIRCLPRRATARDLAAGERGERRVEGLQRVDAGRERGLDAAPRSAPSSRRAVISTSGSSGMCPSTLGRGRGFAAPRRRPSALKPIPSSWRAGARPPTRSLEPTAPPRRSDRRPFVLDPGGARPAHAPARAVRARGEAPVAQGVGAPGSSARGTSWSPWP